MAAAFSPLGSTPAPPPACLGIPAKPPAARVRDIGVMRLRPRNIGAALLLAMVLLAVVGCARIRGPEGWSGGVVVDDRLYIGTMRGELLALNRNSGETRWRFELKGLERDRAIYGTPVVADDRIYVGGYDSILYVLSSSSGNLDWQERLGGPIVGGPRVVDGLVLVGSSDGNLYALDVEDGTEKWRFTTEGKVWSSPAVDEGVVYFGSLDHKVYAVRLEDGVLVWRFETEGAVIAAPLVYAGRVYVGAVDSVFYAIDAKTGQEVWRFKDAGNWFWSHAIADQDTLYAPSLDGNLYALDLDTGRLRWTLKTEGAIVGSPAFVFDMIAVPSADGKLWLARLRDGQELDSCNIGSAIRSPLVERDGIVYLAARDRSIRALRIKPNGNPDEEWVHLTNKDDPLPRTNAPAC